MKVNCLIAEDEPIAQEILRSYIDRTEFLEVIRQFSNAVEAFNYLQQYPVDLLFLDIKMPQMTGIEMLKSIAHKPKVIITSAYRYYATDAFELDVEDYLLKPYSYDRFLKAVRKATNRAPAIPSAINLSAAEKAYIFVKGNKQLQKVYIEDILYVESQRDYLKFKMTNDQEIITRQTIGYFEQFLPAQSFLRIHRSFIVAVEKLTAVEANKVWIKAVALPVGRNYKLHLQEYLKTITSE
jgi:two-component system, LytTR family, response regulator LytT